MIANKGKECTVNIEDIVTDNHVWQTISLLYEGIDDLEETIDKLLRERHADGSTNLHTIIAQLNRRIAHITATRDDYIEELEDKLIDKDNRIDELEDTNITLADDAERWQSTAEVLADKDLMAQIEESKKAWARPFDDVILDTDRFTLAGSISVPMPHDPHKIVGDDPDCYRLVQRIEELERQHTIDEHGWKNHENELLQMISDRDNNIKKLQDGAWMLHTQDDRLDALRYALFGNMRTHIEKLERKIDVLQTHNEMLAIMLKTINPLIRSNEYKYPSQQKKLADAMNRVCRDVVEFRDSHSIVGASV